MGIQHVSPDTDIDVILDIIERDAAVVIDDVLTKKDLDDINPEFENCDVAIVLGANDVVNPDAKENEGSPIYGMPIIEVDNSKTVFVLKRSMASGFAGIQNPLFFKSNTRMLFGDAKETVSTLVSEFKG